MEKIVMVMVMVTVRQVMLMGMLEMVAVVGRTDIKLTIQAF